MTHKWFVVLSDTKDIVPMEGNEYSYWQGDKKGTIDMIIGVFANYKHHEHAYKLYDKLFAAGMHKLYDKLEIHIKN